MRKNANWIAVVAIPVFLAGCGGEETVGSIGSGGGTGTGSGGSGGSGSTGTGIPFTIGGTLSPSFLNTLDTVRAAANALINSDPRYQLQEASGSSYADLNDNGSYDAGVDVLLETNPIRHAGIQYAHAAGLTGAGEVIAISDGGFLANHEAFGGKSVTVGSGLTVDDHGTFVASVAAGNSTRMIGVAPEADLILGNYDTFAQLAETVNAADSAGAVALNNSWGFVGLDANISDYNALFSTTNANAYLNALKTYTDDGIVLFSVPNEYDISTITLMPGLPILEPSLQDSWIAVVNGVPVMSGDDIVSAKRISGACLEAAAWCLAADGSWVGATSSSTTSYSFGTGTSFAAPTIAGALALLAEAFPSLSHQELRIRLLASADNSFTGFTQAGTVELVPGFEHAYSSEWGHGFLDVAAALLPIGSTVTTTSNGTVVNLDEPLVVSGSASGDAVAKALQSVDIASRDALSARFTVNGDSLAFQMPTAPLFTNRDIAQFDQVVQASYGSAAFFGAGQDITIDGGVSGYDLSIFRGGRVGEETFGASVSRTYDLDGSSIEISAAFGDDTAGILSDWNGGTSSSIFSAAAAMTTEISPLADLTFEFGLASGREASPLGQAADVMMNAASLTMSRRNAFARDDQIKMSISLPAAIYSGSTSIGLPVMSSDGKTAHRSIPISLVPEKREVQLALSYERALSRHATVGISFIHAENRGNIAGQSDTGFMFGWNRRF